METTKKAHDLTQLSRQGTAIEFFSAYQEMEIDRMINLCVPSGEVWFIPLGEAGRGTIGEFGRTLWITLMDCFPDLDNTVTSTLVNADGSVTCSVKIFGTQAKDFAGITSKGQRFSSDHIFIFHFTAAGQISQVHIDWDHESFVRQLSA
jgi:predicted ester cyclase